MKRIPPRALLLVALLTLGTTSAGCQKGSDGPPSAASSPSAKSGPEESFEMIVETFRRGVEDVPIGFVLRDEDGHSMMTGRNEVSHKLIPPAKEGEPYRAIITVGSQSRYSIQRSAADEDSEEEQSRNKRLDSFAGEEPNGDLLVLDEELIGSSNDASQSRRTSQPKADNSERTVTRQADRQERNYDLVYKDGKWTLVTKTDPETEQSIQNAFDRALGMQI